MKIDLNLLDSLTAQAKSSPRLRMNYDLRNSNADSSQRMLNALEPGTLVPIHRHTKSSETVVVLRGSVRQNFYDENRNLTESFEVFAGGGSTGSPQVVGFSVELALWHNTECMESGTVILECKDGRYEPLAEEDILKV